MLLLVLASPSMAQQAGLVDSFDRDYPRLLAMGSSSGTGTTAPPTTAPPTTTPTPTNATTPPPTTAPPDHSHSGDGSQEITTPVVTHTPYPTSGSHNGSSGSSGSRDIQTPNATSPSAPDTRYVERSSVDRLYGWVIGVGVAAVITIAIVILVMRRRRDSDKDDSIRNDNSLVSALTGSHERMPPPRSIEEKQEDDGRTMTDSASPYKTLESQPPGSWSGGTSHSSTNNTELQTLSPIWQDPDILTARVPFGNIRFEQVLSRGGFGEVLIGMYRQERVAIKRLVPENRKNIKCLEDFMHEVKLLATLEHERIVAFLGVAWDSPRDVCILLEFMPRGDLRNVLAEWKHQGLPTGWDKRKLRIAQQIAEGLTYLHSLTPRKIVHRDLKSKNVLIDNAWDAKLSDFGISREQSSHRSMTSNVGSSLWIAPEVMLGNDYDEKADIYSFGIVLTELDSHELPYHNVTTPDGRKVPEGAIVHMMTLGKIQAEFSPMSRTDMVLLGRSCLSLDPTKRPTAAELCYRINQVLIRSNS